jgi:hypothetical protein
MGDELRRVEMAGALPGLLGLSSDEPRINTIAAVRLELPELGAKRRRTGKGATADDLPSDAALCDGLTWLAQSTPLQPVLVPVDLASIFSEPASDYVSLCRQRAHGEQLLEHAVSPISLASPLSDCMSGLHGFVRCAADNLVSVGLCDVPWPPRHWGFASPDVFGLPPASFSPAVARAVLSQGLDRVLRPLTGTHPPAGDTARLWTSGDFAEAARRLYEDALHNDPFGRAESPLLLTRLRHVFHDVADLVGAPKSLERAEPVRLQRLAYVNARILYLRAAEEILLDRCAVLALQLADSPLLVQAPCLETLGQKLWLQRPVQLTLTPQPLEPTLQQKRRRVESVPAPAGSAAQGESAGPGATPRTTGDDFARRREEFDRELTPSPLHTRAHAPKMMSGDREPAVVPEASDAFTRRLMDFRALQLVPTVDDLSRSAKSSFARRLSEFRAQHLTPTVADLSRSATSKSTSARRAAGPAAASPRGEARNLEEEMAAELDT